MHFAPWFTIFFTVFIQFRVFFSSASSTMVVFQIVSWLLNCTLEWSQFLCCEACSFLLRDRLLAGSFLVHFPAPGQAIFKVIIISEPFLKWHKRKRAHTLTRKQPPRRNYWLQQEWNFFLAALFGLSDLPLSGCHKPQGSDSRGGQSREGPFGKPAAFSVLISEFSAWGLFQCTLSICSGWLTNSCMQLQGFTGCRLEWDKI